jgi:hypothetical protein
MNPTEWADRTFAAVDLGDRRRERRAVSLAGRMMRHPDASLPQQIQKRSALKAAYRLLDQEDVTHAALCQPHWDATRQSAGRADLTLLIQDTTEIDYTHHPQTEGLGPIGDGRGRGYLLQTVLAIVPQPRHLLGIAAQEPFLRKPAPKGESTEQRRKRDRESLVWLRMVRAVGRPPQGSTWVHIGDCASDIFDFMEACLVQDTHFLVRVAYDRRLLEEDGTVESLLAAARALPAQQQQRELKLSARDGQEARTVTLSVGYRSAVLRAPHHSARKPPLRVWLVRVWEAEPPEGVEPLEWILLTSVPTLSVADAWERVEWYTCRWMAEDYHQCLKTGCRLEQRQLQSYDGLLRLLGFLALIAMRLLQLRELARLQPERLASDAVPRDLVRVVADLAEVPVETLTLEAFWRTVAVQGGYQGRRGDGPPGWKTLWRGWHEIQTLLEGVHLAARLPP